MQQQNAMVPLATVNTKNILFICGGAFPDLEGIIKERLNKQSAIGFLGDLSDKYDNDKSVMKKVTGEDLRMFGMVPEFLGRLPIVFTFRWIKRGNACKDSYRSKECNYQTVSEIA